MPQVERKRDLSYDMVGGRLDYIGARPVDAVVYKRDRHVINLFSWPTAAGAEGLAFASTQGYNIWHWKKMGWFFTQCQI